MTDDLAPGDTDLLEGRLRALHTDTDGVMLADASSVRRRGTRRRRTTQAGTLLGVAVLAVGVVGVAGTLTDRRASAPPATSTPTPTEPVLTLSADPFLRAADIGPIGPYLGFTQADGTSAGAPRIPCLSAPTTWGATSASSHLYFSDLDATFSETVLVFPDATSAAAAAARTGAEFSACPTGSAADATVEDRAAEALLVSSGEGYRLSRTTTPTADADVSYAETAVARRGNIVVVLDWGSMGSPDGGTGWAWSPELVSAALNDATT
ncbi:MAG TPA: hypothetical protein VEV13_03000 [Candidatus Limnocylindria bacterium]|nr:hypothetical protein [Candidatus Limnocylindria bacterium]